MTHVDTGVYGAKVQSWAAKNPRDILRRLIEENPEADKDTLFELFDEEIEGSEAEEYRKVVHEYWFANNYHSLVQPIDRKKIMALKNVEERIAKIEVKKKKLQSALKKEAQILLLDMTMPNGKLFGDCVGSECTALSNKMGDFLAHVAAKLKPDEKVRDVMDENQLRELYERSKP